MKNQVKKIKNQKLFLKYQKIRKSKFPPSKNHLFLKKINMNFEKIFFVGYKKSHYISFDY